MGRTENRVIAESTSKGRIALYSFLSSCSVVVVSLMVQWVIYEDWLHDPGPVRLVGTLLACFVTFFFVWQWQEGIRQRGLETQRRLEVIGEMNDRIRNALQAIECITYAQDQSATQSVREAVDTIDAALRGGTLEITDTVPNRRQTRDTSSATAQAIGRT